jgi:signal peptidase I
MDSDPNSPTPPSLTPPSLTTGQKLGRRFDETLQMFISAALIAIVIRMFVFEPFNIPSSSMVPNLLIGDFLFVSKYSYGYSSRSALFGLLPISGRLFFHEPKRGDVLVFKLPRDNSTDYIKRLIGLPGDTIQMRNGLLYVNGVAVDRQKLAEPLESNYLTPAPNITDYIETFPDGHKHVIREEGDDMPLDNTGVYHVPPHNYFMMGDNRDNSLDSRTPNVSFVPEDNLVGRAEVIFFSIDANTRFWEIWKWPTAIRWGRLFKKID